ncbi:unnamed protein product [Dibothriocephalus latus]|uniref:Uncharacterized protein n=1 Tax=Dibothriocephalus latus TaxID=60516 RepID=A0A3P6R5N5_DIBLA|nr:unnamed protein product [Dibothriocephalus latus]
MHRNQHPGSNDTSPLSLCLVCGAVASFPTWQLPGPDEMESVLSTKCCFLHDICDMRMHVRSNHAGYAFILLLDSSKLLCLTDEARRITQFPGLYRNRLGEFHVNQRYELPHYFCLCCTMFIGM